MCACVVEWCGLFGTPISPWPVKTFGLSGFALIGFLGGIGIERVFVYC